MNAINQKISGDHIRYATNTILNFISYQELFEFKDD